MRALAYGHRLAYDMYSKLTKSVGSRKLITEKAEVLLIYQPTCACAIKDERRSLLPPRQSAWGLPLIKRDEAEQKVFGYGESNRELPRERRQC